MEECGEELGEGFGAEGHCFGGGGVYMVCGAAAMESLSVGIGLGWFDVLCICV